MPSRNVLDKVRSLSRRDFGQQAVFVGVAAALGIGSAAAQSPPVQSTGDTARSQDDEVEARFHRIIHQYGDRLSEEQRTRLRKILAYNEKLLKPIREFPLDNGQPTASVLKFYPDPAPGLESGSVASTSNQRTRKK
jgi:hypothetical protein